MSGWGWGVVGSGVGALACFGFGVKPKLRHVVVDWFFVRVFLRFVRTRQIIGFVLKGV